MKLTKRDFTYGFEIEGGFTEKMLNILRLNDVADYPIIANKVCFDKHYDGSVIMYALKANAASVGRVVDYDCSELAIGKFNSMKALIKILDLFRKEYGKEYFENNSCGLHIHIGVKKSVCLGDLVTENMLKKMQRIFAKNRILKNRLRNSFCKPYSNRRTRKVYNDWIYNEKYRCIKNHEQGTLEMRVFSPSMLKNKNGVEDIRKIIGKFITMLVAPKILKKRITLDGLDDDSNLYEYRNDFNAVWRGGAESITVKGCEFDNEVVIKMPIARLEQKINQEENFHF